MVTQVAATRSAMSPAMTFLTAGVSAPVRGGVDQIELAGLTGIVTAVPVA